MTAPENKKFSWTDRQIGRIIGHLLWAGVLTAALMVLAGGMVYLAKYGRTAASYKAFRGEPAQLRSVGGIVRDAVSRRGKGLIELGLLLLISTPVARVAFSILAFALQRDLLYVLVTIFVLSVLAFSLSGGHF